MKNIKFEQFIGFFPNTISNDLCSELVSWYDVISEQGLVMSSSSMDERARSGIHKKDEVIIIPAGLSLDCFPPILFRSIWEAISKCYSIYSEKYNIDLQVASYSTKIHRVNPSGGYHIWHHEHGYSNPYRILAWHINLEVPKRGGETEFLHQSIRVEPKVGQLTMWPAAFTHKHRGNPPLEGQKTYLTGWFQILPSSPMEHPTNGVLCSF